MINDLVAFLKAHLDEDADLARRCDGAEFSAGGAVRGCGPVVACVGCFHPDRHRPRQGRADEAHGVQVVRTVARSTWTGWKLERVVG
ncbi:hypothetical protein [Streptomyces sp. NBC_01518]|uniref:hypothetical protein n=1 Tax=Streptomyces sp. NBC_01518 TaxID=2903891 RepID=UPI00386AA115